MMVSFLAWYYLVLW